jgi:hypothetical protein
MKGMTTTQYISKPLYQMVAAVAIFTLVLSLVYGVFAPAYAHNDEYSETETDFAEESNTQGDGYTDAHTDDSDNEDDAWDEEDEQEDNTEDDHGWSDHHDDSDENHHDEDEEDEQDGWGWGHGGPKVWICHATENGYESEQKVVPQKGIQYGHGTHTTGGFDGRGDIIPPLKNFVTGLNWDAEHIAIFNANCKTTGEVIITKVVVGGTGKVSDFNLFVGNTSVQSGKKKEMTLGTYTVTETSILTDYVATFSGGCDSEGNITVVPGEKVRCTMTNTYTPAVDVCPNLPEIQTVVPEGYEMSGCDCVPIVVDVCSNVDGVQSVVPNGYVLQGDNECVVPPPTDMCPNIAELQTTVPEGYSIIDGNCILTPVPVDRCGNLDGIQTVVPEGYVLQGENQCVVVPPPTDMCPNIPEMQTVVPQGYVLTEGQCVLPPQDVETYRIYGYVWHDKNENDAWEGFEGQNENVTDAETSLGGWDVSITNGSTTYAAVTAENGYYEFTVPAGTWTITEGGETDWTQTFPNVGGHTVTVPEVAPVIVTSAFSFIIDALIPTAHAAVSSTTYGAYNFGNVYTGTVAASSGSGGGGHGHGRRVKLADTTTTNGSGNTTTVPDGEVLGESTSTMPVGAPNTGAGGTAGETTLPTALALLGIIASLGLVRVTRNVH